MGGSTLFKQIIMKVSTTLETGCILSRDTMELLNILPPKEESDFHQAKAALQRWKKSKRDMRARQEKVRLRNMHEKIEARRSLLPRGTSLTLIHLPHH